MTSKFDPDGGVKRRTLGPSQSGIAPAGDLEGVAGQNSCFLRSQPPDATRPLRSRADRRPESGNYSPDAPDLPPRSGSSPLHLLLGPCCDSSLLAWRKPKASHIHEKA